MTNEPVAPQGSGGLVRLRLDVCYDGTDFSGWARQPDRRTVQGLIEDALAHQPPGAAVAARTVVAGRTDAGVHAAAQVLHVDVEPLAGTGSGRVAVDSAGVPDLAQMRHRWNRYLPPDVRVLDARVAPPGFDARFSALCRYYRYMVSDAAWGVDPLRRRDTLAWGRALDVARMSEASSTLTGLHDFAAFCKKRAGATTVRALREFSWQRVDEHTVQANVSADAFCHCMVRGIVGAVLLVGDGRRAPDWPARILAEGQRCSAVAPAHGLTLVGVDYPPDDELSARAEQTRQVRAAPEQR